MVGLIVMISLTAAAQTGEATIKSFREWKSDKVQTVIQRIVLTKVGISRSKVEGTAVQTEQLTKQLQQEQWNLDIAKDLSVADYFMLYLANQTHPHRFQEAASKMSPPEVAELMEAYAKELGAFPIGGGQRVGVPHAQQTKELSK
jgi:hypothetical protein